MIATPRPRADLAGVAVGGGARIVVMGALNVSPESFYSGSVHVAPDDLMKSAEAMVEAGAGLIDVGAMSTAPYLRGEIPEDEERRRLVAAVELLARKLPVPISADTSRPGPARAAIDAGARILNDVTGLADAQVARLVAEENVAVILMASPAAAPESPTPEMASDPLPFVRACFDEILRRAREAGIPEERIVLDPGIGFFLDDPTARAAWDVRVLAGLASLAGAGRPLSVGVSRKSFIGALTGHTRPAARLAGSIAATTVAVLNGAALVRTHDVAETVDAVRVAERFGATGRP